MKKVVVCAQCGAKMRAGIKFCSKCGYRLKDEQALELEAASQAEEAAANLLTAEEIAALDAAQENAAAEAAQENVTAEAAQEEQSREVPAEGVPASDDTSRPQKLVRAEKDSNAYAKRVESQMLDKQIRTDRKIQRQQAEADIAMHEMRSDDAVRNSKKLLKEQVKLTRSLIAEEAKVTERSNDQLKNSLQDKAHANQLQKIQAENTIKINKKNHDHAVKAMRDRVEIESGKNAAQQQIEALRISNEKAVSRKNSNEEVKLTKSLLSEEAKAAVRQNDELRKSVDEKNFENYLYSQKLSNEKKIAKKQRIQAKKQLRANADLRSRKVDDEHTLDMARIENERNTARKLAKQQLKLTKSLLSEEAKEAARQNDKLKATVDDKAYENYLYGLRRTNDEKIRKQKRAQDKKLTNERSGIDAEKAEAQNRLDYLRIREERTNARKIANEKIKYTKALLAEENKAASAAENAELKSSVQDKSFENRLNLKRTRSAEKLRKIRQADREKVDARIATANEKESKRLGAAEIKSAKLNLTEEATATRRQAETVEHETQEKLYNEKRTVRRAENERRILKQRSDDLDRNEALKKNIRLKENRELGKVERKSLRLEKTDGALEANRRANELRLRISERTLEEKLYAKKLASDKKLIKKKAQDAEKIQNAGLEDLRMMHEAQHLEDSKLARMKNDDTRKAIRAQKNEIEIYLKKKQADDKIAAREHKLELAKTDIVTKHDKKVMAAKEKELKLNRKLYEKYEKESVKRAKKISRISGVPVSLVPALTAGSSTAVIQTDNGAVESDAWALANVEKLLNNSYESNCEQYRAFAQRKKSDKNRVRYAEIGIRDDRKYFNTIYERGEVMIPKRNIRLSRLQGILAVLLMVVALVGSLLPVFTGSYATGASTHKSVGAIPRYAYKICNGNVKTEATVSFETLLTDKNTFKPDAIFSYFTALPQNLVSGAGNGLQELSQYYNAAVQSPGDTTYNNGKWVVFTLLAVAVILNPILILFNLLIGLIRLIAHCRGTGAGITRVMKNLRASYLLLGFVLLPLLVVDGYKMAIGFYLYAGSFVLAVLLNFVIGLFKKSEVGDRKYLRSVRWMGLVRAAILCAAVFFAGMSGIFNLHTNFTGVRGYASTLMVGFGCAMVGLCFNAIVSLGFECIPYTKGRSTSHCAVAIWGIIAAAVPFIAAYAFQLTGLQLIGVIGMAGAFAALLLARIVAAIWQHSVRRRYSLIDPIVNALGEGIPLK